MREFKFSLFSFKFQNKCLNMKYQIVFEEWSSIRSKVFTYWIGCPYINSRCVSVRLRRDSDLVRLQTLHLLFSLIWPGILSNFSLNDLDFTYVIYINIDIQHPSQRLTKRKEKELELILNDLIVTKIGLNALSTHLRHIMTNTEVLTKKHRPASMKFPLRGVGDAYTCGECGLERF